MATYPYAAKIATIGTTYQELVDALDAGQVKMQADLALTNYLNALDVHAKIISSSLSTYANGVGFSGTRAPQEAAWVNVKATFAIFAAVMLVAGVTLESFGEDSITFWDQSAVSQ
jgi:hypothetical protein